MLVLGECVEACVFCKKFFFFANRHHVFHMHTCVCVCVCAWMLVLYVYMYVCMHACLCSYGVYKNLHLTHLLYTAVSFYFL